MTEKSQAPQPEEPMNCNCPNIGACDGSCAPYNQPAPMAAQTAPERIYLVIGEDCPQDITFRELCSRFDDGVMWCEDKIDANSIGYVRADLYQTLVDEVERLRGLKPEIPARPPHSNDARYQHPALPRYGLRWNGPGEPVSVPMLDGYWTPFHLALAAAVPSSA